MIGVCIAVVVMMAGQEGPAVVLRDVARERGVDFRFDRGSRGRHDLPEIMGGGVALIDADCDGRRDLYFSQGGPIVEKPGLVDPPSRLYCNRGDRFVDETERSGAPGPSYAMGAAVGDVDGDGREDLFVTGWRGQRLYRSQGDGTFEDVTTRAGLESDRWSTSAAFADLDEDGDLDLFVATYVDYDPKIAPFCAAPDGKRDYCGPEVFPAQADFLYRNDGQGRFVEIASEAGIDGKEGRGLGVLIGDLVGDRRLDILVANDGTPSFLYENRGGMRFVERGREMGLAVDGQGQAMAAMGLGRGDVDGDGRLDLVITNFLGRSTVGFRGLGEGGFQDVGGSWGLSQATRQVLGFGVALVDLNGDGRLDLVQANGHVLDRERLGEPLTMPTTLLTQRAGRFVEADAQPSGLPARRLIGRGLATGDVDGDGRPDVVVAHLDAPPAVLRNESKGRWLAIRLKDARGGPAIGARVAVRVGGRRTVSEVFAGGSYLSASDRTVFVGLDGAERADVVEVEWPSGRVGRWEMLRAGRHLLSEEVR